MKRVYKFFWAWDFDKEEEWLNQMAHEGKCLKNVGLFRYDFEECASDSYHYQLEFLEDLPDQAKSQNYLTFLEDMGVEHVGTFFRWVYLRKKKEKGPFELFSDNQSKIKHLGRILNLLLVIGIANLLIGIINAGFGFMEDTVFSYANNWTSILNFFAVAAIFYGVIKISKKKRRLEKEGRLYE